MVSRDHGLSLRKQCELLQLSRSRLYYQPVGESAENLRFVVIIDQQFLETPWYGSRQMARYMKRQGHKCGRHRVRRLMRLMRLVPIYQEPNTSKKHPHHKVWPYLLRNMAIDRPNQVPLSHILRMCCRAAGAQILPTSQCDVGSFIWSPSWIGIAARFYPGACPIAWTRTSAWRL